MPVAVIVEVTASYVDDLIRRLWSEFSTRQVHEL